MDISSNNNINDKQKIATQFQNTIVNKIDLNKKKEDIRNVNKKAKLKQAINHKTLQITLKFKKRENKFCSRYEKYLKSI